MALIASMDCACCGDSPVSVHHIRTGQGGAQRASDFLTIPLCPECHQGKGGIHGDKSLMRVYKKSELSMLADTIEKIERLLSEQI